MVVTTSILNKIRRSHILSRPMQKYRRLTTERRIMKDAPDRAIVTAVNGNSFVMGCDTWETANFFLGKMDGSKLNYEPMETAIWEAFLSKASVVLDIGAHVGYYSLLSAMYPNIEKIYAVEILDSFAMEIRKHAESNAISNIRVFNHAIATDNRKVTFTNFADSQSKQGVSLDTFCRNGFKPDLIKMDIEGWEHEALVNGAESLLKNVRPMILLGLHPPFLKEVQTRELVHSLMCLDYHLQLITENGLVDLTATPTELCSVLVTPREKGSHV